MVYFCYHLANTTAKETLRNRPQPSAWSRPRGRRPCVRGTFEELRGPLGKGKLQAAQRGFLGELTMAAMAAMVSLFMVYDAYEWL